MASPITKINTTHLKVMELMLHTSLNQKEIAKEVGITDSTISIWKSDPIFVERFQQETKKYFDSLNSKAIKTVEKLMSSQNERVALDASKVVIDKCYATLNKNEISSDDGINIEVKIKSEEE